MPKALEGLRVVDATHVLAGPFATYQLAVLGAEVIKVESPHSPDQARMQGADRALNDMGMGTAFMAQASNKKAVALDLKTPGGLEAMKRLLDTADVFVANFRPGAFDALGLGYEAVVQRNPRLVYCAISAFGSTGPKQEETGYDNILQAYSGIMSMTGTRDSGPLKCGAQVVDYATGLAAAFAISTALFQRAQSGKGQFIDVSMLDVSLTLCTSHIAGFLWNGSHPEPKGNRYPFATIGEYRAADTGLMIAASNLEQQRKLWTVLGREDMIKTDNNQRLDGHAREAEVLAQIISTRTAQDWETLFRSHRIPAARIRRIEEALSDPHVQARGMIHRHEAPDSPAHGLSVVVAPCRLSDSPPEINRPPQPVGAQTQEILAALGYSADEIEGLRRDGAINGSAPAIGVAHRAAP